MPQRQKNAETDVVCMRLAALHNAAVQALGLSRNVETESESYQSTPRHPLEVREALKDGAKQWTCLPATSWYTTTASRRQIALQNYL